MSAPPTLPDLFRGLRCPREKAQENDTVISSPLILPSGKDTHAPPHAGSVMLPAFSFASPAIIRNFPGSDTVISRPVRFIIQITDGEFCSSRRKRSSTANSGDIKIMPKSPSQKRSSSLRARRVRRNSPRSAVSSLPHGKGRRQNGSRYPSVPTSSP